MAESGKAIFGSFHFQRLVAIENASASLCQVGFLRFSHENHVLYYRQHSDLIDGIVKIHTGWLDHALTLPSPNFDDRPVGSAISLIVIHCISLPPARFGCDYISKFFTNQLCSDDHPYFETIRHLRVSAHLLIQRNGEIIQYVPFHKRAWHAGMSCYAGKPQCNDFAIGIELEGTEEIPYTDEQYGRLADTIACLIQHYPTLSRERIVGHSDIAPGRKTDPGDSFKWDKLYCILEKK